MTLRHLHVVPHLHLDSLWDRTSPGFGERLEPLLDEVLGRLESGALPHLLLDGQMVLVEDWLERKPEGERAEHRARITRLVTAGRLALGPWFVRTEAALIGAELHEWNLRLGLELGDALGGAQRLGYLPDTLGQLAGMPALLRRCGIAHAAVWGGTPAGHESTFFRWVAPDGAEVTAAWFFRGAAVPRAGPARRLGEQAETSGRHDEPVLLLGDTNAPETTFGSLAGFLAHAPAAVPELRGELPDPRRQVCRPGARSSRTYLKLRHEDCERLLFRELLPVLMREPFRTTSRARFTQLVRTLLRNASHDAAGGTCVDTMARAMEVRYDEVEGVGRFLRDRALAASAGRAAGATPGTAAEVAMFATRATPSPIELTCDLARSAEAGVQVADGARRCEIVDAVRGVVLWDGELSEGLTVLPVTATPRRKPPKVLAGREVVRAREHVLSLGGPTLRWKRKQGFTLEHAAFPFPALAVARFEDLADRGDLHDHCSLAGERPRIFDPCHLTPVRYAAGELFQEFELEGVLRLPPGLTADRTARITRRVPLPVRLLAQVRKGEPFVRLTVELTNTVHDHRLRLLLPFPGFARRVVAGMPFFPQERPAHAVADPSAPAGIDTHPFHGWVDVSDGEKGLAVFARGLREYEVVRDRNQETIALTLVRAVGWLSREDLATRPGAAAPQLPAPEAQCLRSYRFELALFPHGELDAAAIAATAERFLAPPFGAQLEL